MEQKQYDIGSIVNDIKRIKSAISTEAGLNKVLAFLQGGELSKGRAEGMREGWKKGQVEGRQEIARNLKAMGIPIEQIVQGTGLTEDQIREL